MAGIEGGRSENGRKWGEELKEFAGLLKSGVKIVGEEDDGSNVASALGENGGRMGRNGVSMNVEEESGDREAEGFQEQIKGFLKSTGELLEKLGQGCRDVVEQSLGGHESEFLRRCGVMWGKVSPQLEAVSRFLPEDRNPLHVWSVLLFVFFSTLLVLRTGSRQPTAVKATPVKEVVSRIPATPVKEVVSTIPATPVKEVVSTIPIITADRIRLPDGRYIAYREEGVSTSIARHSILVVHSFLSSRLAGIPGIKHSLLEEFGVRLVTYDLPGFGQSDPQLDRNLTSSALDMKYIADVLGLGEKFWIFGHSGGGIHVWAALRYIPERLAGAALFAPMGNPYEPNMAKDEIRKVWEKWTLRRRLGFILAKRASYFLPFYFKRSFWKKLDRPDETLSFILGKKDGALVEQDFFIDFQLKDMQESTRQDSLAPFVEEITLQVKKWGFSLADLQVRKKRTKGFRSWFLSLFNEMQEEWEGFLGPIHIWQGMDDRVVPYPFNDYAKRMVPGVTLHKLIGEGHFSYFYFCDRCHREIFITVFGIPEEKIDKISDLELAFEPESAECGEL